MCYTQRIIERLRVRKYGTIAGFVIIHQNKQTTLKQDFLNHFLFRLSTHMGYVVNKKYLRNHLRY